MLRIDERFHAEAAADIAGDQPDLVLRQLEHRVGERVADEMRSLCRGVQRRTAACRIVFGDGVARLHRIGYDAVVDQFELDDMRRIGECGVGCLGVAGIVVPVEHQVAGNMVEQLRRAGRQRIFRFGHGGQ